MGEMLRRKRVEEALLYATSANIAVRRHHVLHRNASVHEPFHLPPHSLIAAFAAATDGRENAASRRAFAAADTFFVVHLRRGIAVLCNRLDRANRQHRAGMILRT